MDIFGVIVLSAGIFNKIVSRRIFMKNVLETGKSGDLVLKSFDISMKDVKFSKGSKGNVNVQIPSDAGHIFRLIEIHEPKLEKDDPIYVGSPYAKVPVGGGSRVVYNKVFRHVIHNFPDVDMTECQMTTDVKTIMKTYEFNDLRIKFKNKYNINISKCGISSHLLRVYTSTDVNNLHLLGTVHNGIFIAKYGGTYKEDVLKYADAGNNWSVIMVGVLMMIIGLLIRIYSEDEDED